MKKPAFRKMAAALLVGAVIPSVSFAAVTMYLKIDGVNGEVKNNGFEKAMQVYAVSWGMQRQTQTSTGIMRPCTQVTALELVKPVDIASPVLMANVMSSSSFPKAKLSFVKGGEVPQEFMTLELTGVSVSGIAEASSVGEDVPTESVSLKFTGATFSYKPQDDKGGLGQAVTSTFKGASC